MAAGPNTNKDEVVGKGRFITLALARVYCAFLAEGIVVQWGSGSYRISRPIRGISSKTLYPMLVRIRPAFNFLVVATVLLLDMREASCQFSYAGLDIGYARIDMGGKSSLAQIELIPGFIYRPIRHFGVGVQFHIPVIRQEMNSFVGAPTTQGTFNGWGGEGRTASYTPEQFEYTVKRSVFATMVGRWFMDTKLNAHIDLTCSFGRMQEELTMLRNFKPAVWNTGLVYGFIPARDEYYKRTILMVVPGVAFGISPHIGQKYFIKAGVSADLIDIKGKGFSYDIEYDYVQNSNQHEYVTLESSLNKMKVAWTFGLGAGRFF